MENISRELNEKGVVRIAQINDPHFAPRLKIPQSRNKEKYHTQILGKWDALNVILKEQKVDYGVIPGDIFHLKNSDNYTPEILNYYTDKFFSNINSPVKKWFTIPGNHDMEKSAIKNLHKSAYTTLLQGAENMQDLAGKVFTVPLNDDIDICISGLPFAPLEITAGNLPNFNKFLADSSEKASFNVALLHIDAILDDSIPLFWETMSFDQVLELMPDTHVFCLGHIHQAFPVYTKQTETMVQMVSKPWNFSRIIKDYYARTEILEKQHIPQVSIITITPTSIDIQYHNIPCAPFDEAFIRDSLKKTVEDSVKFQSFMEQVKESFGAEKDEIFQGFNSEEMYEKMVIPEKVREKINEYIEG